MGTQWDSAFPRIDDRGKRSNRLRRMTRFDAAASGLVRSVVGRHGFAAAGILTDWPRIVGERVAAGSQPIRLRFPKGSQAGGILHLCVGGSIALEIQHMEPQLIERINRHFGYAAIIRLKLFQGVLPGRDRGRPKPPPLSSDVRQRIEATVAGIEDSDLRAALVRLGTAIHRDAAD